MGIGKRYDLSSELVDESPEKAKEVLAQLASKLDQNDLENAVKIERHKKSKSGISERANSTGQSDITPLHGSGGLERKNRLSSSSPLPPQSISSHHYSPPGSVASSVTNASGPCEFIQFPDSELQPKPISYIMVPGKHHFIAYEVVDRLGRLANQKACQDAEGSYTVDYRCEDGTVLTATAFAYLTYIRTGRKSHDHLFHVLKGLQFVDVLLANDYRPEVNDKFFQSLPTGVSDSDYNAFHIHEHPGPSYHRSSETSSSRLSRGKAGSTRSSSTKPGTAKTVSSATSHSRTGSNAASGSRNPASKHGSAGTAVPLSRQPRQSLHTRNAPSSDNRVVGSIPARVNKGRVDEVLLAGRGASSNPDMNDWVADVAGSSQEDDNSDVVNAKYVCGTKSMRNTIDLAASSEKFFTALQSTLVSRFNYLVSRTVDQVEFGLVSHGVETRSFILPLNEESLRYWPDTAKDIQEEMRTKTVELRVIIKGG